MLLYLTQNRKKSKNNPTKMVPRTKITHRPKTAKAKANAMTKTKQTPSKKAKTDTTGKAATIATTGMTEMKKDGRHADDESFFNHFGGLCKYKGIHGKMKVPRTSAGKNQPLANGVHYISNAWRIA
jgi:hypothetical protein